MKKKLVTLAALVMCALLALSCTMVDGKCTNARHKAAYYTELANLIDELEYTISYKYCDFTLDENGDYVRDADGIIVKTIPNENSYNYEGYLGAMELLDALNEL